MTWGFESPLSHHINNRFYRNGCRYNETGPSRAENYRIRKGRSMNVTVEEVSAIRKKLIIEVAADVVATEIENAYKKIAKTADLKGFRKGKIPRSILEQHYAPRVASDAVGSLVNNSLYKAMIEN